MFEMGRIVKRLHFLRRPLRLWRSGRVGWVGWTMAHYCITACGVHWKVKSAEPLKIVPYQKVETLAGSSGGQIAFSKISQLK